MGGVRPQWAVKGIVVIVITSILFRCVSASNYTVGGPAGWELRSNLQMWSAAITFFVGDNLVFTYTPIHDVVEVDQVGYDMCIFSKAIGTYDTGETVINLTEPGTRYFVCGRSGHCAQGLKLQVLVLALPNNGTGDANDDSNPSRASPRIPPSPRTPIPRSPPPPTNPILIPPPPPATDHEPSPPFSVPTMPPPPPAEGPCQCSGAKDGMANSPFLYYGLVPLIRLVLLSFTELVSSSPFCIS